MALSHNDNGYKSRKWNGFLLAVAAVITAAHILPAAVLTTVSGAIVALYATFCGANVGRDWAALKNGATIAPPPAKVLPGPKKDEEEGS